MDTDGTPMNEPAELGRAVIADWLGQRYGVRPSETLKWDAEDAKLAHTAQFWQQNRGDK